nr:hypothetical protein [Tanacetum cinerariifolium]
MIEQNFFPVISRINAGLDLFLKCLNEEMVVDLRYFNSLELEVDSLTSQLETQRTQFVNEIDRLSREYYYADHMHAILGVYTELDEVTNLQCDYLELLHKCKSLETELSKSKMMSKSFESVQKHAINLELKLQQCKEKTKNDMSFKVNKSKDFRKEREQYFEIQDLKAQLQDKGIAISELKKLIEKLKGKSMETKFEKSSVIQKPNAFKSQRPSILGKLTTFSNSFVKKDFSKSTSVTQTHVSNDFSKPVTAQILPANKKSILKNTNVLNPGMYKLHIDHTQTRTSQLHQDSRKTNKRVSFSTGVSPTTSVSRPQLKSNPRRDRVMHNNSQGKKQEVEDHCRSVKLSKNKTSVTTCNDSLNAKTLNVQSIFAICEKYVLHDKHDMSKYETPEVLIDFLRLVQRGLHAQMASVHVSSDPFPQCQRTALEHDSLSPDPQCQENVAHTAGTVTTSNELDLLFSLMFDELLNGSTQVVSKSSAVTTADAPNQCQQQHTTPLNTHTTPEPTCQFPTQAPTVTSTDSINQAEMNSEDAQVEDDDFINIFCTPVQDRGRHHLVMLIHQICIHSINVTLLNIVGRKIIH